MHCSLKCFVSALPEFNQLFDFFNIFDSQLILTLLYDSLSFVISAFSYNDCWVHVKEVDSAAAVGLCCTRNAPLSALSSVFSISQGNAEALDR